MSPASLLLHVCCAPCAAYPVPALRDCAPRIAGYFYNPNIQPAEEHARRLAALKSYAPTLGLELLVAGDPEPDVTGDPDQGRGEERCRRCYEARLRATAREARRRGFAAFSTTLLFSIHQRHELIRAVAGQIARAEEVPFLYRDLRAGWSEGGRRYRESGLYRQRYCGCPSSARERDERRRAPTAAGPAAS